MSEREERADQVLAPAPDVVERGAPAELQERSCLGATLALAGVLLGAVYVINPGSGLIELIPDVVPVFGNLDEAAATTILVLGLQYLFRKDRKP